MQNYLDQIGHIVFIDISIAIYIGSSLLVRIAERIRSKNVTDEHDLMIINKSGIAIRLSVAECRVMGRATQGVKLINLTKKNDVIASVCKVMGAELEAKVEQLSRNEWSQKSEEVRQDMGGTSPTDATLQETEIIQEDNQPIDDVEDIENE